MGIVYCFHCQTTGKKYIGVTTRGSHRYANHKWNFHNKKYPQLALYRAMEKYGWEDFIYGVIEESDNLHEREIYWIDYYNTTREGYNMSTGGDGGTTGYIPTEEQRKRRSEARMGFKHSPESIERMRISQRNQSQEKRDRISETMSNGAHFNISEWELTYDTGEVIMVRNLKRWCRENGYNFNCLQKMNKGKQKSHKNIIRCLKEDKGE